MTIGHADEKSPLLVALMEKRVKAETIDLDHFRIHGGMAVETDYIIRVESKGSTAATSEIPDFEYFLLSKTYSSFRTLAHQLKKSADVATTKSKDLPKSAQRLAQYCETVVQLVESQRTQYLGKVSPPPPPRAVCVCCLGVCGSDNLGQPPLLNDFVVVCCCVVCKNPLFFKR